MAFVSKVAAGDYGWGLFPFISGLTSEAGSMSQIIGMSTIKKTISISQIENINFVVTKRICSGKCTTQNDDQDKENGGSYQAFSSLHSVENLT